MSDFTFDFTIFLISYYLFHFFATVWTTTMVIFSKKKTVIIILNMMCFNLHLYFKVFYTNLSFMEQFYIKKKKQNNSIIIFLENLLTKLPVVFKLGICGSLVWFFFHRTWSFNRSYTVALEANWKNWTTRQKKNSSKKKHPPPPRFQRPCIHVCM